MKLRSYNILFSLLSFLADKTNGLPLFVKYKLLLGTLIIGLTSTSAYAQRKNVIADSIPLKDTVPAEISCYKIYVPPKEKEEVKGRVKDEHGEPIAGVSILIRGTAKGTISDIDGAFSIEAKSTDELVFSFIGMYSVETSASTLRGGEAIITMKEENMILCYEVVIIRHYPDAIYRRAPKKTTKMSYTEVRTVPVSPVGDLKDFQKWVQSNIRYSEQMKKDKIQGEVILSFAIDKKGRLTDKKVIGKLSKDADKEALRALSLSGAWEPGGHYGELIKTTMIISVNFGDE